MNVEQSSMLSEFTSYLSKHSLIDLDLINDAGGDDTMINRLKLQKYVFLAKEFGLDLGYKHNMHLLGPYSRQLAHDRYDIDVIRDDYVDVVPKGLRSDEFFKMVHGRSHDWLDIACTIIYKKKFDKDFNLERACMMKYEHPQSFIEPVYKELENRGIIS